MIRTDTPKDDRRVIGWRYEELVRAGYPEPEALQLAGHVAIDLHRAIELLRSGCPPTTAIRILV